jgi:hypothetical protein
MEITSHPLDPKIKAKVKLRAGSEPSTLLFQCHQDEIISCEDARKPLLTQYRVRNFIIIEN